MEAKKYIYMIKPARKGFNDGLTEDEEKVLEAHFHYLQGLMNENVLLLAGPCVDAAFGIVIIKASTDEAATKLMINDPAVKNNVMKAELHPFHLSLVSENIVGDD